MEEASKTRYAVLGATGQTGQALIQHLYQREDIHLHLYARSASRLHSQNPKLASHPSVTIHTGDLSDIPLLTACLRSCSAIFSVVATNVNAPATSIAQRTAHSVTAALRNLRDEHPQDHEWRCPVVIMLSAAPLNRTLSAHSPRFVQWLTWTAFKHVYLDLQAAAEYYRSEHPWIPMIQAQPGGLVVPHPNDREEQVTVSVDKMSRIISYTDLARGMVRIAEERNLWEGLDVSFVLARENPKLGRRMMGNLWAYLLPGLVYTWVPWVYALTHR